MKEFELKLKEDQFFASVDNRLNIFARLFRELLSLSQPSRQMGEEDRISISIFKINIFFFGSRF
jgi:hypothetical protein